MKYKVIFEELQNKEDKRELYFQLATHNKKMYPNYKNHTYYSYSIKDGDKTLGGIEGYIWLGINHIDRLFVDEKIRGQGYGKKLLKAAEEYGEQEGVALIALENIDFQGTLRFYLDNGFTIAFKDESQKDIIIYHLRKNLLNS